MRHIDMSLTMSRYSHAFRGQESDAVERLPDLTTDPQLINRQQATGTDDENCWALCWAQQGGRNATTWDVTGRQIGYNGSENAAGVAELADATDSKSVEVNPS
jgi:hypothetical protein